MSVEIWKPVIDALPNIFRGIIWIGAIVIVLVKVVKPILEKLVVNHDERKRKENQFKQEKFWKYIQLSQIDKDAEIKKKAEDLAQNIANEKFNEKKKDLEDLLRQKELDWYKKFTEETKGLK